MDNTELFFGMFPFLLKCNALWPNQNGGFKGCLRAFTYFLQYSYIFGMIVYVYQLQSNLEAITEATYLFFTQSTLCIKMTLFNIKSDAFNILMETMNDPMFKAKNKEEEMILKEYAVRVKRRCGLFLVVAILTCALWGMIPLFDEPQTRTLPFKVWHPLDLNITSSYIIMYIYQMVTIYTSAFIYNGTDALTLGCVMFCSAQLKLLSQRFHVLSIEKFKDNYKVDGSSLLRDCIIHHQKIIKFIEMTENFFGIMLFVQILSSVGIICICEFRIYVVNYHSVQFASMLSYFIAMSSQLYVTCLSGQELTVSNENFRATLNDCNWYLMDNKFKKNLLFIMQMTGKTIILKAGTILGLSYLTFMSILKTSYSVFALMQRTAQ